MVQVHLNSGYYLGGKVTLPTVVYIVYTFQTVSGDGHLAQVPGLVPSKVFCTVLSSGNL